MNSKKFKEYEAIDEDKLWERYNKGADQQIRDFFVLKYAPLVKYVAGKFQWECRIILNLMTLFIYGIFGLLDAINKFDPARGINLKHTL
jgi:RNA polymerase sigma factor for flagellar operon FliA